MSANRLLIIDDEPNIAKGIETIARGCGYAVEVTHDAARFFDRVGEWQPSHIVLDLQMPGADGVELLRGLGARRIAAKVVIASGVDGRIIDAARRLGIEQGVDVAGTLIKPFRAAELRQLLQGLAIEEDWCTERALAAAIENQALFLEYQPKVDLRTGEVTGFEGLVRWQHPRHGTIYPDRFIPLAESGKLMDRLTEIVIGIGLEQAAEWSAGGTISLALNLSSSNLHDLDLSDRISQRCRDRAVDPHLLIFELTETSTMADPLRAMDILTRLRLKGFRLAVDDFGTGYSSLLQLARLPFSELKIDKSFVMECARSPEARAIVKSTIDLAHNLGLRAVAEGIESEAVQAEIAALGGDLGQGYAIARPMPVNKVAGWLATWETRKHAIAAAQAEPSAAMAHPLQSPWTKAFDGSTEMRLALEQALVDRVSPLWELGRRSLLGWRPADGGIDVLMAPYENIVKRYAESRRLLTGKRLMGDATFRQATELAGVHPVHVPLPFLIGDLEPGAVSPDVVEAVLRRYGITETQHRACALFDIVGFSKYEPRSQVAQLNSLECSINTAQRVMHELGRPIDLARSTTGDGFYIWNREKGATEDLDTYLLTLLILADNALARRDAQLDLVPLIRTCFSVGPHYSYHQIEGLDPVGRDYIVGDVTISLARMVAKCMPGQILIGDFTRPNDDAADPTNPLEFVLRADGKFGRFDNIRLHGVTVNGIRCYLTGPDKGVGQFDASRFRIRDKHGFDHYVYNQKFNLYLAGDGGARLEPLYLGRQHQDLAEFDAVELAAAA